jgi:hypothetical protein
MGENIEELKKKIALYEQDGGANLFYALNRKANEMAKLLNKVDLSTLALDDKNDKTFERLKIIWNDSTSLSTAIKTLEGTAGITNDEDKDTKSPKFQITTPESISNVLGNK